MTLKAAKEGIEKELTCPLCMDIFQEPKKLPCDHIYCKEPCLQGLLLRSFNGTISCPECRTVVPVPQNDLNNLPTAFRINRLKGLYQELQQKGETDSGSAEKPSEKATCTTHASQLLAIYCETCEELLCRDCLLKSDKHKKHNHGFIEEVAEKQREEMMKHVRTAKECQLSLLDAIKKVYQERSNIEIHRKMNLDKLEANFDAIISALTQEKEQLQMSINNAAQQKTEALVRQDETITESLKELSATIGQAENTAQNQSNLEITKTKSLRLYTDKLQLACIKTKGQHLQPVEHVHYGWHFSSHDEIVDCYKKGIHQYTLPDPQKCLLQVDRFDSLEIGKQHTAVLQVKDYAGKTCQFLKPEDIQVEFLCISNNKVTRGTCTLSTKGRYTISVTPLSRGRHVLSVKVKHIHICGSPFSVFVQMPPQQLGQLIRTITYIDNPAGLTCCTGKLYVTNYSEVFIVDENFKLIETHPIRGAGEIAIDAETGDWFVATTNYQLHKLNMHGEHIKSAGGKGSSSDQFDFPNGIQVSKSGEVFVCDTHNGRIKVYDKELCLQRIIGKQGSKKGSFNWPDKIAFDETGNLFVTEQRNHRVQVLTPSGKIIFTIGKRGYRPGELDNPTGIAISSRYVYITDNDNTRISVFTTQGEFITTFGEGLLQSPECIAIDRDGYVYVSDKRQQILVF